MWVFRKAIKIDGITKEQRESYEVGYFNPTWGGDSFVLCYEFTEKVVAAQQVHFLNGGN